MNMTKSYEWFFKAKVVKTRYSVLKVQEAYAQVLGGFPSGQRGQTVNLLR